MTSEQLRYKDITLLKQLRDCAISVSSKKNKLAISEMFSTELKFASECLMSWFNSKFKNENLQLTNAKKRDYKIKNPVNWESDCCCICIFPLEINPTESNTPKGKMPYADFIAKEHKFLRNIFSEDELSTSEAIKNINSFHLNFSKFLKIVVCLQNTLNLIQGFSDCNFEALNDFCRDFCEDCVDFIEMKEKISDVQIKSK